VAQRAPLLRQAFFLFIICIYLFLLSVRELLVLGSGFHVFRFVFLAQLFSLVLGPGAVAFPRQGVLCFPAVPMPQARLAPSPATSCRLGLGLCCFRAVSRATQCPLSFLVFRVQLLFWVASGLSQFCSVFIRFRLFVLCRTSFRSSAEQGWSGPACAKFRRISPCVPTLAFCPSPHCFLLACGSGVPSFLLLPTSANPTVRL
jgi:hypothetical protein